MTRRMIVMLTALLGVAGVVLASASPASAQTGIPFVFDFVGLFTLLLERLDSIFSSLGLGFLDDLFANILERLTGSCAPFCAS